MPRVHSQVARKDIYARGAYIDDPKTKSKKRLDRSQPRDNDDKVIVKKGQKYYWWKFRYGGMQISATYPKPQQLTQSSYLISVYDIQDRISEISASHPDDLESEVDEIKESLEELKSEQEDKLNNMPEQLQYAPTGELLQERIDSLDAAISEFDGLDLDYDEPDEEELRKDVLDELSIDEEDEDEITKRQDEIDSGIERLKEAHMEEWIDEKIGEIRDISFE